jgi:hypothetical protein
LATSLASALRHACCGGDAPALNVPAHPVLEHLLSHRFVRLFVPVALPDHAVARLAAAAPSAVSSTSLQTRRRMAVKPQPSRESLAKVARNQAHIHTAPSCKTAPQNYQINSC